MVICDPYTGDLLGFVGGRGEKTENRILNLAAQSVRASGSSIKPLAVYGPAVEEDIVTWGTVIDDVPVNFGDDPDGYVRAACEKAHANGIAVNVFWADDPVLAKKYLDLGCDVILTNDYQRVSLILK